jgi:hypothetical protein
VTEGSVHQMRFLVIYLYIYRERHICHPTHPPGHRKAKLWVTLVLTVKVLHSRMTPSAGNLPSLPLFRLSFA